MTQRGEAGKSAPYSFGPVGDGRVPPGPDKAFSLLIASNLTPLSSVPGRIMGSSHLGMLPPWAGSRMKYSQAGIPTPMWDLLWVPGLAQL